MTTASINPALLMAPATGVQLPRQVACRVCLVLLRHAISEAGDSAFALQRLHEARRLIDAYSQASISHTDLEFMLDHSGRPAPEGWDATWMAIRAVRACREIIAVSV